LDDIVKEIVKKYWKELRKKKNVKYFSGTLKPKVIKNKEYYNRPCFRIYVTRKEPYLYLPKKDRIPKTLVINGKNIGLESQEIHIETDVYPIGEIKLLETCRTRKRPVKAGCSATHYLSTACTLGWFAINKKPGEEEFLGIVCNNHCGARENRAKRGDAYVYPSPRDGGTLSDKIAIHWRHVPLNFNSYNCIFRKILSIFTRRKEINTEVDASLERLTIPEKEVKLIIFKIGKVKGKRRGELGELAKKTGRTTGLTTDAKLIDNDWYGEVEYGRGTVLRGPCGILEGEGFSAGGDSSSAIIWTKDNYIAGLLCAGSYSHTVFDHYNLIEKLLEVEFIVTPED